MNLHTLSKIAKISEIAGAFNPAILRISILSKLQYGDDPKNFERTFFHEYIHFLQSIGNTYNYNLYFEVMDYIAIAVKEMGGDTTRILDGFSKIYDNNPYDHLNFHFLTLDGRYGSRIIPIKEVLDNFCNCQSIQIKDYSSKMLSDLKDCEIGYLNLNLDTKCYEYIRLNNHDDEYFATPLGACSFQETMAYICEHLAYADKNVKFSLRIQFDAPSQSYLHYYNAPLELFYHSFKRKKINIDDMIATLLVMLDISLQIPPIKFKNSHGPNWVEMTSPSWRFERLFKAVYDIRFVNHNDEADYIRFMKEISDKVGWPSPLDIWIDTLKTLSGYLDSCRKLVSFAIDSNPKLYENHIIHLIESRKRRAIRNLRGTSSDQEVEREMDKFIDIYKKHQVSYIGISGLSILEYMVKALQLRIDRPTVLILPHKHYEYLTRNFPIAEILLNKLAQPFKLDHINMGFYDDLQTLVHTWAIARQWFKGARERIVCGMKYFDINCEDNICQENLCPEWPLISNNAKLTCPFSDIINILKLYKRQ
jgi:hypothetical protein